MMLDRARKMKLTKLAKGHGFIDIPLRYNPIVRNRVFDAIQRFARADASGRRLLAEKLTSRILRRAAQTEYGKEFGRDWGHWPVLGKDLISENSERFVAPGLIRIPAATGGTTGLPLRLSRSAGSVAAEQAFLDSILAPYGLTFGNSKVAVFRGDEFKSADDCAPPFGIFTHGGRRLVLSGPHLSADTLEWYVDALTTFQPDVLLIYPTNAANLMMLLGGDATALHIPLIVTSSEQLHPSAYRQIEQAFGANVIDFYGQSERVCLAIGEGPERYRFQPAYGRVELLPAADDDRDGERRSVRIVATGYWNEAMPLIRYDTGDCAIIPADADATDRENIALGLQPFFGIAGRNNEFLYTPSGIKIAGLSQIPREVPNVIQAQLVQNSIDAVAIHVVAMPRFGEDSFSLLMRNARKLIPSSIRIEIERVDRLETTASGKAPYIIHRFAPD